MNITELRKKATAITKKQRGVNVKNMEKRELIHHIQVAEGNRPCFKGDFSSSCGHSNCLWYKDCTSK